MFLHLGCDFMRLGTIGSKFYSGTLYGFLRTGFSETKRLSSETFRFSSDSVLWKLLKVIFGNFKGFFGNCVSDTNLQKLDGFLQKLMFGNYEESKSNIKPTRRCFCRSQNGVAVTRYVNNSTTHPPQPTHPVLLHGIWLQVLKNTF